MEQELLRDRQPKTMNCLNTVCLRIFSIYCTKKRHTFGDETVNTHFLPDIDFKNIINDETLSEKTKQIIWKYLQLILFTVIGTIERTSSATTKDVRRRQFRTQKKINETISSMMGFFGSRRRKPQPQRTNPTHRQRKLYTEPG
jgi:hypothetical protein